jgi:hypothetical protein
VRRCVPGHVGERDALEVRTAVRADARHADEAVVAVADLEKRLEQPVENGSRPVSTSMNPRNPGNRAQDLGLGGHGIDRAAGGRVIVPPGAGLVSGEPALG